MEKVEGGTRLVEEVTQQNAALVEQAAAESMEEQAQSLMESVSIFKLATAAPRIAAPRIAAPRIAASRSAAVPKTIAAPRQPARGKLLPPKLSNDKEWEEF